MSFSAFDQQGNCLSCLSGVRVIDAQKEVRHIQRRIQAVGLKKAESGSGEIAGFLLHQSQIGPQLRRMRAQLQRLRVVGGGGRVVARGLRRLRVREQGVERGRLLAESKNGPGQQHRQQRFE